MARETAGQVGDQHGPLAPVGQAVMQVALEKKSHVVLNAGTLPGAVNVPTEQLISAGGTRLAGMAKIDAVLAKAGVKTTGKQISFCNTGHLASTPWFVLHEVKGNKDISLYDGSMADWTRGPNLPVVNGAGG